MRAWVVDMVEKKVAPNKVNVVLVKKSDMAAAIKEYRKHSLQKMMKKFKKG